MCISYQIHWICDHIVPLDTEPTKCTTYLAAKPKAIPTASVACPDLTHAEFKSEEVCPDCTARILGLTERARERRRARMEGMLVDEMDVSVTERSWEAWLAKRKTIQERADILFSMVETGLLDEGLRQMGML